MAQIGFGLIKPTSGQGSNQLNTPKMHNITETFISEYHLHNDLSDKYFTIQDSLELTFSLELDPTRLRLSGK